MHATWQITGIGGARTKLEASQSSEAKCSGVKDSVFQISGEVSRNGFFTPASAQDSGSIYPLLGC